MDHYAFENDFQDRINKKDIFLKNNISPKNYSLNLFKLKTIILIISHIFIFILNHLFLLF